MQKINKTIYFQPTLKLIEFLKDIGKLGTLPDQTVPVLEDFRHDQSPQALQRSG